MSEAIKVEGRVNKIGEEQEYGTFRKVEVWLETDLDGKYPQMLSVEFTQDNIAKIADLSVGDMVSVSINLRGRYHEGTDRVYNSIVAWNVRVVEPASASPAPTPPADDESDEIPF